MRAPETMLDLQGVTKRYGAKTVLQDVSLGVETVSYTHLTLPTKA